MANSEFEAHYGKMQGETKVQPPTETFRAYADKAHAFRRLVSYVAPMIEYIGLMSGVYGVANDDLRITAAGGIWYLGAKVAGRTMPLIHRDWCFARLEEILKGEIAQNKEKGGK